MIDLHCHILPGIDDGAADIVESIEMARIAAADGIGIIVATPHVSPEERQNGINNGARSRFIDEQVEILNRCLGAEKVPVKILRGAEVSASLPVGDYASFTLNHSPYVLIEFPSTHLPVDAGDLVFSLIVSGLKPILAHPERNPSILRNPEKLLRLVEGGALVQITGDSLTGDHGPESRACARYLLREGVVGLIASDGHGARVRPPRLSGAFQAVRKSAGLGTAERLFLQNPKAVISGKPLNAR